MNVEIIVAHGSILTLTEIEAGSKEYLRAVG